MSPARTQLNINIDPALLLKLKSEAIKNGMTLTQFVTLKLSTIDSISTNDALEARLARIEKHLHLSKSASDSELKMGAIFTDQEAKRYG